jgi:hypothetical protein
MGYGRKLGEIRKYASLGRREHGGQIQNRAQRESPRRDRRVADQENVA